VNIENEIITVTGNADIDTIKNKLKQMGYPEKGKNSLKSKAVSYISCAIGRLDN
jgi:UDP-N-acetylglucosamine 2-epimerase